MQIAIVAFDRFNEIDTFVAAYILNRARRASWVTHLTAPTETLTSMSGVHVQRQQPLSFAREADVVIVSSARSTGEVVQDAALMGELRLDPTRQLIAGQCSGALILARLGLLHDMPVCTDLTTKPWVVATGARVLERPFYAQGNVATVGGCLGSYYLAAWILARTLGRAEAEDVLGYVTPVGEQADWAARAFGVVGPYL
jgi:transcriptional regulator GlxA family with amidase domain